METKANSFYSLSLFENFKQQLLEAISCSLQSSAEVPFPTQSCSVRPCRPMQPLNAKGNLGLHWDLVIAIPAGTADKGAEFDVDQKYY